MQTKRISAADQIEKPNNILTEEFPGEADLVKNNTVVDGKIISKVGDTSLEVEILAFHQKDRPSPFFTRMKEKFFGKKEVENFPPQLIKINHRVAFDEFNKEKNTQLMGNLPYCVLEDGTKYGISINVPNELLGDWVDFQEPKNNGLFISSHVIEVGRKKEGIAIAVRTDGTEPLVKTKVHYSKNTYHEMFFGVSEEPSLETKKSRAVIHERVAVIPKESSFFSQKNEGEEKSIKQDLIFNIPPKGKIAGSVEDQKGLIQVIVYRTTVREVTEIITKPRLQPKKIINPTELDELSRLDSLDSMDFGADTGDFMAPSLGMDDALSMNVDNMDMDFADRSFVAGETVFGEERKEKVNVTTIDSLKPIANIKFTLVGEDTEKMTLQQEDKKKTVQP